MGSTLFWIIVLALSIGFIKAIAEKNIRDTQKKKYNDYKRNGIKKTRNYEVDEHLKNIFKPDRQYFQDLKEKGDEYEKYVSKYFSRQGYTIAEHGQDNGRRDHGIDVIAKKDKEIIFIQCKNWKVSEDYKIDHRHIKEFIGNCTTYMEKNPMFGMCTVKRYFAVSDEIMDYSAERFISENPQSIQKLLLVMPKP